MRLFSSALRRCVGVVAGTLAVWIAAGPALAQDVVVQPSQEAAPLATFTPDQLDQLLGPIALYPDPLIAQILPASTYPVDIVRAARLVRSGASTAQIDAQSWDPSVKAVAHYPSVIEMMDSSIEWTQQLGQAFIAQPDQVMDSIQRLRVRAQNLGNLVSTPQQDVVVDDGSVLIVPAQPAVVYVPVYNPAVVYYQQPAYLGSYVTFGFGLPCGIWLDLSFDWVHHWCYRPGWSWNRWHDHIVVDHGHVVQWRGRQFHPGERPPTVWRRDEHKPLTFPGRRLTDPREFDRYRGREHQRPGTRSPEIAHPRQLDRGRGPAQRPGNNFVQPPARPEQRVPSPRTPGQRPQQQRAPDQRPQQRTPTPRTPTQRTPTRVAPPPVRVAPPPTAPTQTRPPYVRSPQPRPGTPARTPASPPRQAAPPARQSAPPARTAPQGPQQQQRGGGNRGHR